MSEHTRITLVPHTHWDREWYAPFGEFSERLVSMMDTLLELAERGFPHFHLDGQTAVIDDYLAVRPEREDDVRRHVREGRISAGPWVAQMDEFLTSGESHVRNLEMGLARARELGRALEVGYMPDQFGHIGQMPQILRLGGLERAVVWRGVPREVDRDAFWWESPDGSRVLTEYMAFGYFNAEVDDRTFDRIADPEELASAMETAVERQRSFMASDRMLVMLGYDHSGPDATFPERLEAARPHVRTVDAEVGGLAEHLGAQRMLVDPPVWRGELRSSARAQLLPNVYSARVHQKRERGRVEALLERYAEPLAAQAPSFGWPKEELDRAWTLLLWNGAHDSACGCSHDQVAIDVDARFAEARMIGEDIVERALTSFGSRVTDGGVIRYNPSSFDREGVLANGWRIVPHGREPEMSPVSLEALPDGSGVAADDVPIRLLDEPDVGDLYNFCYEREGQSPSPPDRVEIRSHEVDARWAGLRVLMRIIRRADEDFLRLEGVIHNERPDHRLRLHIGLSSETDRSLAGSPFELVERPLVGEGSALEPGSPTWPARGVVMAADKAVLHEGVFEYEVLGGRDLAVTLLRCVGTISRDSMATRPWAAGPDVPTPLAQMIGETTFALGVWPDATREGLLERWERFALPIAEAPASGGGTLPSEGTFIELGGDAALSSIRWHERRLEVRVWNPFDDREALASVAREEHVLRPAEIRTVVVDRPSIDPVGA
jgi:alpha-mannosidase